MTSFAFVFPGQGSQAVGMLDAWGDHPAVRDTLAEASAALDQDLAALIHAGPKDQLDLTTNTQPVMLTAAIACWRAWRAEGGAEPSAVAGHSLGEYSALVAAGAMSLADAVPLVRFRAQAMQQAVPVGAGAMAAILGLDPQAVREGCAQAAAQSGEVVEAANFNDPKQTVIAGSKAGVDKACEVLKAAGAKRALLLPVSAPFHCSLMKPAADALKDRLASVAITTPRIAVVNNIDAKVETDPAAIRDALYRQAFGAVRWVDVVKALVAGGQRTIIECGPGKVLAGMVKRIDADAHSAALFDPATLSEVKGLLA
jgi:[acyl-carrier-protein] S-malonyltransferase